MYRSLTILLFLFIGCTKPVHNKIEIETPNIKFTPTLAISQDSLTATIISDGDFLYFDSLLVLAQKPIASSHLVKLARPNIHDSTVSVFSEIISESLSSFDRRRNLKSILNDDDRYIISFSLDTSIVYPKINNRLAMHDTKLPLSYLFDRNGQLPSFSTLRPTTSLQLPCEDVPIPSRASRLPNAPRAYRSGIHRGVDFFSSWGTPVRAVTDGIIIRSDLDYEEYGAEFRVEMLERAAKLNRTPSDIFNELLLGQAVIIDHGFELFPGYRAISIYAHLSHIESKIKPGYLIKSGEVFGRSGNTGTRPSTIGSRAESHLHWELILQDNGGEYYFGQNLEYEELRLALDSLFAN